MLRILTLLFAALLGLLPATARADIEVAFWTRELGLELPHAFITIKGIVEGKLVDESYGFTPKAITPAILSIRFTDLQRGDDLVARIRTLATTITPRATVTAKISGEAFLTPPGALSSLVADVIRDVTGIEAELSTTGGTSDARFLSKLCPTVEFGLCNATMHKLDEAVALDDLTALTEIYARILAAALPAQAR